MRRLYGISAAMMILAAALAGCGSNASSEKAPAAPSESAVETSAQSGGQARELSEETAASETEVKEEETKVEGTKEQETAEETTAAQTEAETAAEEEPESASDEAVEKDPDKEASDADDGIPVYVISQRMLYEYDQFEGEYKQLSGSEYECAYLTDEAAKEYPALDKALNEEADRRIKRFEEEFNLLTGECRSMIEEGYPLYAPLTTNSYIHVHRADGTLFSYLACADSYLGGAHGDYGYGGYTFDTKTGKALKLEDLVKDIPALGELVIEKLKLDYDERIFFESYQDTIRAGFDEKKTQDDPDIAFTVEPDGISFWFEPYLLAAYASGMQTVHIRFEEAPELFKPICTEGAEENYSIEMEDYVPLKADVEQNGTTDEILVYGDMSEYGEYQSLHVQVNGKDCTAEDAYFYRFSPVYIRAYEHDILLVDTITDNDYHVMYTFDLRENGAVYFGSENSAFGGEIPERFKEDEDIGSLRFPPADTSHFRLWTRYDLLSTLSASRWYSIGAQDVLIPETAYYDISNDYFELTTLIDMELDRIDEESDEVAEEAVTVPKGTKLKFFRSDCETYTDLKDKDGNVWRVKMDEKEDWPPEINGRGISECFDGIMFAG